MRLLLVEDDLLLGDGIRAGLAQEGYAVDWLRDGLQARQAFTTETFDLVVLDLGLPRLSGIELLEGIRHAGNPVPVLILTARDTPADRIGGLDAGADDYLVKPFDLGELCARVRALLRRAHGRAAPLLRHGGLVLDPAAHSVIHNGRAVDLPRREFIVLQMLLENAGSVVPRSRLEEALYGWSPEVESNTLEVFIHHLRRRFGADLIRTVRGVGYTIDRPSD